MIGAKDDDTLTLLSCLSFSSSSAEENLFTEKDAEEKDAAEDELKFGKIVIWDDE